MFSLVCLYNDEKILDSFLLRSLKNQSKKFQLILLDNTKGKFKSAASGLNCGGRKAKGEYIIFVHQDVDFYLNKWLEKAENILDSIFNLGIAGIAGMSEEGKENRERGRNIIFHGEPKIAWSWGNPIKKPTPVQTLDECLLIIPKSIFKILQFDEKTCDGWHLYGVDYCLSIKKLGYGVYAIPLPIYHRSAGSSFSEEYFKTLAKVLKKHRWNYSRIYTTMGDFRTKMPLFLQRKWLLIKSILSRK